MLQEIQDKIDMLLANEVIVTRSDITLEERETSGQAYLKWIMTNEFIVFIKPEQKVFPFLKDGPYRCCADKIIFENIDNSNNYRLHIIEFKKTVDNSKWEKARHQFKMALLNARSMSGFLGINIVDARFYTGFRFDKLSAYSSNPVSFRIKSSELNEWITDRIKINIDSKEIVTAVHTRIQLDQTTGMGEITI